MVEHTTRESASDTLPEWPTRMVMLLGGLMVTLALTVVAPVLPRIEQALAHSADERLLVKMLVPFASGAMVVGAPLTGFLIDRFGVRSVLLVNALVFALAGTSGYYLTNLHVLLASRLFVGLSASGMATISVTLINTRLDGAARARWVGYHIATAMFGSLAIYPAIGALGERGWHWPFLVYGIGFVIALFAALGLQQSERRRTERIGAEATPGNSNPLRWFPLRFLPLALVIGGVTYLPIVYLAFVARDVGLTSTTTLSTLMLADALIGAVMALLFGWSQRHMSSATAFVVSFSCAGAGMAIVSLANNFPGIVVGMLVFGLATGWFMPNLMLSLSRQVTQDQQGRAIGILKAAHFLSSPLAVLAVEPIARRFGSSGAMTASAIVCFCMVVLFAGLARYRREPV